MNVNDGVVVPDTGVEILRTRLLRAIDDLQSGRITPAEAIRITREANRELRRVEATLRIAKLAAKIG